MFVYTWQTNNSNLSGTTVGRIPPPTQYWLDLPHYTTLHTYMSAYTNMTANIWTQAFMYIHASVLVVSHIYAVPMFFVMGNRCSRAQP